MGRKDASGHSGHGGPSYMPPVESYRKQIGKQDYKKGKKDAKARKRQSEYKRSAMTIQEIILMTGAGLAILVGLYFFLFWSMGTGDIEVPIVEKPVT